MLYDEELDMKGRGIKLPPITKREARVLKQPDGHWCMDWDGLAVSALTIEYDSCACSGKSKLGRVLNWFVMRWFNLEYWWLIGRHRKRISNSYE